jgi:nitrogen fixation NifU-like protein
MTDPLDDLVERMQGSIDHQIKEDFGEAFYQRWKAPGFFGRMSSPDGSAVLCGSCGDVMEIYLSVKGERVAECSFFTTGCGPSIVCGSVACELARGKDLEDAAAVEDRDILALLQNLPSDKEHCAHLAAQTLREAVRDYWQKGGRE